MFFQGIQQKLKTEAANDLTETGLKVSIIVICLLIIALALMTKNKIALAAILAYIILP